MRVVILGNGVAGMEAALLIRNREPDWEITVISEESDHFFSRTALMWVACGQMSHRDIEPYERDVYARSGLTRIRGRARGVDVQRRCVRLQGEPAVVEYDRLLIACGSKARPAPWSGSALRGVGHFVTMQDLEWLEREVHGGPAASRAPRADAHLQRSSDDSPYARRAAAAEQRGHRSRRPAVIGGGLIGMEVVEVMLAAGIHPRLFIREEWFWPMAIDSRESRWVAERTREHGVDVLLQHNVEELIGDEQGNIARVRTDQGEYDCDLAVVTIGVVPATEWLEDSDIERDHNGAIIVDDRLRTSAPGVYAAGDCAGVRWFDGKRRPEPLWYTARAQGRVAARSLLGERAAYDRGVWFNSAKLIDIEYTTVGFVNLNLEQERNFFYEETGRVRSTTRVVLSGEQVVGFNLLGRRWDHSVLTRWIHERRSLRWVLDHLQEASFDTEFVPPLRIPEQVKRAELHGPAPSGFAERPVALPDVVAG